jgi:serine protease Do
MESHSVSTPFFRRFAPTVLSAVLLAGAFGPTAPALAQTPPAAAGPAVALPDFSAIIAKADPAVVNIRTTATVPVRAPGATNDPYELFRWFFGPDFQSPGVPQPQPSPRQMPEERKVPRGVGSGFFITADGYILTNNHVVSDAADIYVTLTDGREFKAKVIGTDERTDVALIKIDAKDMTPLKVGDPKQLQKGQWVLAIGSPFGLDSTATAGIVSAISRDTGDYLPFIQTDVAVNPGNSGGPLINLNGEVVGINSQIVSRSGGFMGISLAIPIDEAMRVADQLRDVGKVTRGRIGVQIGEVGKEVAEAIGLPKAEGALVSNVETQGPAGDAGVRAGDVILSFNGEKIKRWSDLPRIVGQTKPGTRADMEVWRRGKTVTLSVKVGELEAKAADGESKAKSSVEPAANALGLTVVDVPEDMQSKLGIKGGVLVRAASGPAGAVGLQPGDIVLALNNSDISDAAEFNTLVGKLPKGKAAGLLVRRGEQAQWVAIEPSK